MKKATYNWLKKELKEATDEAWRKYYSTAKEGRYGEAAQFLKIYEKIFLLDVDLKGLLEENKSIEELRNE